MFTFHDFTNNNFYSSFFYFQRVCAFDVDDDVGNVAATSFHFKPVGSFSSPTPVWRLQFRGNAVPAIFQCRRMLKSESSVSTQN